MNNLANIITLIRALLGIIIIIFLKATSTLQVTILVLILIMMIGDMFDGLAARKTKTQSVYGSVYDILADRIIEFTFFIFFASVGVCNVWATLIIVCRGLLLDATRGIALGHGKTAFGKSSLHEKRWTILLTSSRFSRGTYNTLKTIAFMAMALQFYHPHFSTFTQPIIWITVSWSLLRAIPVLFDGYCLITTISEH